MSPAIPDGLPYLQVTQQFEGIWLVNMHTQPGQHLNHSNSFMSSQRRAKTQETLVSKAAPVRAPVWHLADADLDLRACTTQLPLPKPIKSTGNTASAICTGKTEPHNPVEKQPSDHQL